MQVDCELHVINLCLEYGMGLRDNYKTINRVRTVTTEGGELPAGKTYIQCLRRVAEYVSAPQKSATLRSIQDARLLPLENPRIDVTTRIAYTMDLIRTSVLHHQSLCLLRQLDQKFTCWDKLDKEGWDFLLEMEAVMVQLASYALLDAQKDLSLPSHKMYHRFQMSNFLRDRESFNVRINCRPMILLGKTCYSPYCSKGSHHIPFIPSNNEKG